MGIQFTLKDVFVLIAFCAVLCYGSVYPSEGLNQIVRGSTGAILIIAVAFIVSRLAKPNVTLIAFTLGVLVLSIYGEELGLRLIFDHLLAVKGGREWTRRLRTVQSMEPLAGGLVCSYLARYLSSRNKILESAKP